MPVRGINDLVPDHLDGIVAKPPDNVNRQRRDLFIDIPSFAAAEAADRLADVSAVHELGKKRLRNRHINSDAPMAAS